MIMLEMLFTALSFLLVGVALDKVNEEDAFVLGITVCLLPVDVNQQGGEIVLLLCL